MSWRFGGGAPGLERGAPHVPQEPERAAPLGAPLTRAHSLPLAPPPPRFSRVFITLFIQFFYAFLPFPIMLYVLLWDDIGAGQNYFGLLVVGLEQR